MYHELFVCDIYVIRYSYYMFFLVFEMFYKLLRPLLWNFCKLFCEIEKYETYVLHVKSYKKFINQLLGFS